MRTHLARAWHVVVWRGILGLGFGMVAFWLPQLAFNVLVALFGAYALADGIFALTAALYGRADHNEHTLALEGLFGIAVGMCALFYPAITALGLLYIIAFWALTTGFTEIRAALALRKQPLGAWLLALVGGSSVAFGTIAVLLPETGVLMVTWLLGSYALSFGIIMLLLGARLYHSSSAAERWRRTGMLRERLRLRRARLSSYRPADLHETGANV